MTTRRQLLHVLAAGAIAVPLISIAQTRPTRIPRIAFLAGGSRAGDAALLESFWQRMKGLGYVEGKNITAEYRFAEGALERLPAYAAELVRLDVDVIVGPGSGASAASKATQKTPIVLAHGDPLGTGLVASLAAARRKRYGTFGRHPGNRRETARGAARGAAARVSRRSVRR